MRKAPPKKSHWRGALLVLWAGATLAWATGIYYYFDIGEAIDAYARVYWYENQFAEGGTPKPHLKQAYHQALENSEDANRLLGAFLLIGLGFPGLILAIGTWLTGKAENVST